MIELKYDPFLENIVAEYRPTLIRALTAAVIEQEFSIKNQSNLDQVTTKEAIDKVDELFKANNCNDPRKAKDGKQDLQIKLILKGYKNKYPSTKQYKSFTPFFICQLFHRSISGTQLSIANIAILGFFCTIKYCEHVNSTKGYRNTQLIRTQNIKFWVVKPRRINLNDPGTFQDQAVYLTFENQNNGEKCTETHKKPL